MCVCVCVCAVIVCAKRPCMSVWWWCVRVCGRGVVEMQLTFCQTLERRRQQLLDACRSHRRSAHGGRTSPIKGRRYLPKRSHTHAHSRTDTHTHTHTHTHSQTHTHRGRVDLPPRVQRCLQGQGRADVRVARAVRRRPRRRGPGRGDGGAPAGAGQGRGGGGTIGGAGGAKARRGQEARENRQCQERARP